MADTGTLLELIRGSLDEGFADAALRLTGLTPATRFFIQMFKSQVAALEISEVALELTDLDIEILLSIEQRFVAHGIEKAIARRNLIFLVAGEVVRSEYAVPARVNDMESLCIWLAELVLSPAFGGMNIDLMEYFIEFSRPSKDGKDFHDEIEGYRRGEIDSCHKLLRRALPYYSKDSKSYIYPYDISHSDDIGEIYRLMTKFVDDPNVAAVKASLDYEFGHATQENEARELGAIAALKGSEYAWSELGKWIRAGDVEGVVNAINQAYANHKK